MAKRKEQAKVGDVVRCWKITKIYLKDIGSQKVKMARVKSTIDEQEKECRLTLLTNAQVGYPDRRRPDLTKRNTTHGMSKSRLYRIWYGMKNRCYNQKQSSYHDYGAKGITVCDDWKDDFVAFKTWAESNGYEETLTLDRKDTTKNYCPENCRWSDWNTQSYNRGNRKDHNEYEAFGERKSIYEWSNDNRCNVKLSTLQYRVNAEWNFEEALTKESERSGGNFNLQDFYQYVSDNHPEILEEYLNQ